MRYIVVLCFLIFSCSSKKDILLIQDIDELSSSNINFIDYKVNVDDILKISINPQSVELLGVYNNNLAELSSNSIEILQVNGYLVNSEGTINVPAIGNLYVKGKSLKDISKLIYDKLISSGELVNPSVDVKIINSYFTVLGEVNRPGRYNFINNNLNILQAIGIAGDLTINGKRKDIKIIRFNNGNLEHSVIDLTTKDFINSKYFQIFSGDIILVNPNNSRVKNAGIIGNSGTLLSLLSFLLSAVILITSR